MSLLYTSVYMVEEGGRRWTYLEKNGIPCGQRCNYSPKSQKQRRIPWRNRQHHAHGLLNHHRHRVPFSHRQGTPHHLRNQSRGLLEQLNRRRHIPLRPVRWRVRFIVHLFAERR